MTPVETTKGALKTANVVLSQKLVERDAQIKDLRRKLHDLTTERDVFKAGAALLADERTNVINVLNIYADEIVHDQLTLAGLLIVPTRNGLPDEVTSSRTEVDPS